MKRLRYLTLLALALTACNPRVVPETSEEKWLTGAGPARGHEDITRIAVDRANTALESVLGYRPYASIAKGVAGMDTGNAMVKGNFETDFPTDRMYAFHDVSSDVDWHNDGRLQHLHSLRDYPNGQPLGLRPACEAVRSAVLRAARVAIDSYRNGDTESGQYWLGHATHVIQDSFSPAHASRAGDARKTLVDLCVYGIDASGMCKHGTVDLHDRVWRTSFSCQTDPNNRSFSCLKPEAQDAVNASAAFLTDAGQVIFAGGTLDEQLQGYFACETLAY